MTNESEPGSQGGNSRARIDIPLNLNGEAQPFVWGGISHEEISKLVLVEVEEVETGSHKVHVGFTVWEDSGSAEALERQLYVGDKKETDAEGKPISNPIYVFEPYGTWLMAISESSLNESVAEQGYLWQVARYVGVAVARNELRLTQEQLEEPRVQYRGVEELPDKIKPGFGIDNKVDTLVKHVTFEVTLIERN